MKRFGFILLLMATLALSCTREALPGHDPSETGFKTIHYKVLVSSFDDTKATTADNNTKYVFQATDSLYVSSTDPGTGDVQLFGVLKLIYGSGETTAYFEGDLVGVDEFEPASDTPINVTLVCAGDRIHTTGGGKLTNTSYPANEYAADLAEAVQKFSHFTCSTTFGATSFTLSQQSAFLIFNLKLRTGDTPVNTVIDVTLNDGSDDIWASPVTVTQAGRLNFVAAFPGGGSLSGDAELSLSWTDPLDTPQTKSFGGFTASTLTANHYYTVSRSEFNFGGFRIKAKFDGTTMAFRYTDGSVQFSDDSGETWTVYDGRTFNLNAGDEICFQGTRTDCDCVGTTQLFTADKVCYIAGDITSLLADNTQYAPYAFRSAFSNGTCVDAVTTPEEVTWVDIDPTDPLLLPGFTSTDCYREMFRNCTSLTSAPDLPAETAAAGCYWNMFRLCTGLETANINLAATTLGADSCRELFRQCSNLTSVPVFRASVLAARSYRQMLASCTKLGAVTCLATNISASGCLDNWMQGIKSTGTLYKSPDMNAFAPGSNGIPSGWTVQDAS